MNKIFSGVKVVDLTKVFSGPFATRMLADYGAEVIKIENEANYDDSRNFPPLRGSWSGYFEILNRNKKSISLDLKNDVDLHKLYELAKTADVFVENLTPNTKTKLKIDYETLKKINPKIIYASLSGLGQSSNEKYYDIIAQAQSGLLSLTGTKQQPIKIGPAVVDAFSGMTLAFSISSALFYKQKTGKGQYIDVSMLACAYNLLESNLISASLTKQNPDRTENQDNTISPFGIYKTKDGYIAIAVGNESLWKTFCQFLSKNQNINGEEFNSNAKRLEKQKELTAVIEKVFSTTDTTTLIQELKGLGIPVSKVNQMLDVLEDEFSFSQDFLISTADPEKGKYVSPGFSVKFSEQKDYTTTSAPKIGDNNKDYGI